jgi:hypothetical protein
MAKKTTGGATGMESALESRPTMGTEASKSVARQVLRGTLRPKGGATGGMAEPATAVRTPNIPERLGNQGHPTAALYAQNAPEAGLTGKTTRTLAPAMGNRDSFYDLTPL